MPALPTLARPRADTMKAQPARSRHDLILLFGGESGERRVSVASGQYLLEALEAGGGAPPVCWFWAPDGPIHEVDPVELRRHEHPFEADFLPARPARFGGLFQALDFGGAHERVLVLALHGGAGEDGTLQRACEERGLAFTGSGSVASGNAFDKALAQEIAWCHGLRVPESCVVDGRDAYRARKVLEMLLERYGRAVLKPVADGSSVGLHILHDEADLEKALEALAAGPSVVHLAEAFVAGIELTVSVIDTPSGPRALPCSEVRVAEGRTFDYSGKYLGQGAVEITPAEVSEVVAEGARRMAVTAHVALGCEGYSRTDVIVDSIGPAYIETNTLPGLTRASFLPQQLAAAGIPMQRFLADQIERGWRRARARVD